MQAREQQAQEIESRLAKLRRQYQQREAAKDRIIDLQLQVIEQDAAGLGFPGSPNSSATPTTSIRGGGDRFRNTPAPASSAPSTDPMIRSGLPSPNVPARRADQHDPDTDRQRQTAQARVAILKQQREVLEREYRAGKVTIDRVLRASNDLLEAELELADSAGGRIKILEQQLANLEMLEAVAMQAYKADQRGQEYVLAAKADRIAAQTRLDRERNRSADGATRSDVQRLQGVVEYDGRKVINLIAPMDARAERVYVDHVGAEVEKGDALVELHSAELFAAEKELFQARKSGQQSSLAVARDMLRLRLGLSQEQIDSLEEKNEATGRLTLYSPTNGVVTSSHAVQGARVRVNDQLFTIADTTLWVQLQAPNRH
jgi:biotin carboxyl carrier protein